MAPDGRLACAPVTSFSFDRNAGSTELWLFPTGLGASGAAQSRARRLTSGDKDGDPRWSPDGSRIAFTAKRKDDTETQVYLIAPDGGEATRLTNLATGVTAIKWFPDGKRIAFVSWVWPELRTEAAQARRVAEKKEAKVKAHLTERGEYRFWDHWLTDGREPHVFACDVATRRCEDLLKGTGVALQPWDPTSEHYDLSPDGREGCPTSIRSIRRTASRSLITPTIRRARSTIRASCASSTASAANHGSSHPDSTGRPVICSGRRIRRRSLR
jgi:dipeptidyl aminopeptidase/acylaminoacyl peptidase